MTSTHPRLLVFVGPSGTGKSAIVGALAPRGIVRVHPTWTTRPPRADEGAWSVEHRFVPEAEFLHRRASGFFLHTVQMFGMPHWYGLPPIEWSDGAVVDAVMLRAPLIPILRSVYPEFLTYQVDAPHALVDSRLAERGCPANELDARRRDNEREIVAGRAIADRHFHNHRSLAEVVDEIEHAIRTDFAASLQEA